MNKVILADSQAIFRAGTAKVLAMDEDMRIIAQCTDLDRMMHAISTFPGSIVVLAASLRPDMARLRSLLETSGSRGIVIAENNESASAFMQQGFRGVVFRNVTGPSLVERYVDSSAAHDARVTRRGSRWCARARPAHAEGNANCGPDCSRLQEPRNCASA